MKMIEVLDLVNTIIAIVFAVCYTYQLVYIPISLIGKPVIDKKRAEKKKEIEAHPELEEKAPLHNLAVLICARNEEVVITDLIDSIHQQTYPQDHIHIFLMADNCTDRTAEVAEAAGATAYTRNDTSKIGKGYALDLLLKNIKRDYPDQFDAFMVFDADNVLRENFFEEMNKCFSKGNDLITCYRNTKNYGSNWISAGYALWFIRESRYLNMARSILHISSGISGTGFLFSKKIADELDGWPFHMLTEDLEFTANQITQGRKIAFCDTAELFDEQPIKFTQSFRQRLRWARGYWEVLDGYLLKMIKQTFHGNFSCFDMAMNLAPAFILTLVTIVSNVILTINALAFGDSVVDALIIIGWLIVKLFGLMYGIGLISTITEWKHIQTTPVKKILYTFTFPLFIATYIPISIASIFHKPTWKPIEHTVSMKDMEQKGMKLDRSADNAQLEEKKNEE